MSIKISSNEHLIKAVQAHDYSEVKYALDHGAVVNETNALFDAAGTGRNDIVGLLLDRGADVNKGTPQTILYTPLSNAVAHRHTKTVQLLFQHNAKVFYADLESAVRKGDLKTVELLAGRFNPTSKFTSTVKFDIGILDPAAKFSSTVIKTTSILHIAAESGSISLVRDFLALVKNINILNEREETPLHLAIEKNDIRMVRALIEMGADVNLKAPLKLAVRMGRAHIVEILLAAGAPSTDCTIADTTKTLNGSERNIIIQSLIRSGMKLNEGVGYAYTLLHAAAGDGDTARLQELLESKQFSIDADTMSFGTPLCEAVRNGHCDAAKRLLLHGADKNFASFYGCPLLQAVNEDQYEAAELLLTEKADVNNIASCLFGSSERESPLQAAASKGDVRMVLLLLEYGADVKLAKGGNYQFPLAEAAHKGHLEVMEILLKHGADVHQRSHRLTRETALHAACNAGSVDSGPAVHLLLDSGADINARTSQGETPLYLAATYGKVQAATALLRPQGSILKMTNKSGRTEINHTHADLSIKTLEQDTALAQCKLRTDARRTDARKRIYQMLRAKGDLSAIERVINTLTDPAPELFVVCELFNRIIAKGFNHLNGAELHTLYIHSTDENCIGSFAAEFSPEIKMANKLFLYARGKFSYLQRAFRTQGQLPQEIIEHIASFVDTDSLPYDRGGNSWLKKICSIKESP